jgi:phage/plasmid-like protein (TIGR03299 family)
MSANINYNSKTHKFAFYSLKQPAWHGLGQVVETAVTASEALKLAQLDYEVKTGPVYASFIPEGGKAHPGNLGGFMMYDKNGNFVEKSVARHYKIPNIRSIYRNDTKDVFGTVTDRYEVVQNAESLDLIYQIIHGPSVTSKEQIKIETAGALNKGETIFVTARMPGYMIDLGTKKDFVDKYIVITTSHNSSSKLTAIITDTRVVCNNTLQLAMKNYVRKVALRHTKYIRDRFGDFADLLRIANKYSEGAREVLEHLARVNIDGDVCREYVYDLILPSDKRELVRNKNINTFNNDIISARYKNKAAELFNYIEKGPGQDVARGTAYWLYNGATSYYHNGVDYKTAENKFMEIFGGSAESNIVNAYDKILAYV